MALRPATEASEARRAAKLCTALTLLAAAGLGLYQIGWGQRFAGHGIGKGDSRAYLAIAQDFPGLVFGRQLDSYRLQRVLPSGIVYLGFSLLGLPRDEALVVSGFQWLNLASMLGMLLLWHRIADTTGVSHAGRWLGCLLLLGNFACLRAPYYNPVLTDYCAAGLGALLLYGYLRERAGLMLAALAMAAFTWPALLVAGAFLVVFPRRALPEGDATRAQRGVLAGLAMAGFVVALLFRLRGPLPEIELDPPASGWGQVWLHRELLPISLPLALLYVGLVAASLWSRAALFNPSFYREAVKPRALAVCAAALLLVKGVTTGFAAAAPAVNSAWWLLQEISLAAVVRPVNPWVAHAVAFGLLPLLLTLVWRAACRVAHQLGAGFTLFLGTLAVLALSSESRQLMHGLVPLTLLAVLSVEGLRFPSWARWTLATLGFAASKLWLDINQAGFFSSNHPFSTPAQNFWMHVGPWMSDAMYWQQGGGAIAALALLALAVRRSRALEATERDELWPPVRTVLAFPAAACLVAALLGAAELGARLLLRARLPAADPLSAADATRGWRNVPGASGRPARALVEINRRGLRGPERDYPKPAGTQRVLLLGGSIVEAWNLEEASTLRANLERGLRGCGTLEVLNAGVAGYSIDQQLAFYEAEGRRYYPNLVVVVVHYQDFRSLLEDEATPTLPQGLRAVRRNPLPWRGSAALRLFSDATLYGAPTLHRFLGGFGVVDYDEPPRELWPFSLRDEAKAGTARFEKTLGQLAHTVSASNGRLGVLYAPARFEVDPAAWDGLLERYVMPRRLYNPERLVRRLERITDDLELPLFNTLAALQNEARGATLYDETGLWNETGSGAASRVLAETASGLLGCGAGPR